MHMCKCIGRCMLYAYMQTVLRYCLGMCVCIYVHCIRIHIHICVHICVYVHLYILYTICVHVNTHTHTGRAAATILHRGAGHRFACVRWHEG